MNMIFFIFLCLGLEWSKMDHINNNEIILLRYNDDTKQEKVILVKVDKGNITPKKVLNLDKVDPYERGLRYIDKKSNIVYQKIVFRDSHYYKAMLKYLNLISAKRKSFVIAEGRLISPPFSPQLSISIRKKSVLATSVNEHPHDHTERYILIYNLLTGKKSNIYIYPSLFENSKTDSIFNSGNLLIPSCLAFMQTMFNPYFLETRNTIITTLVDFKYNYILSIDIMNQNFNKISASYNLDNQNGFADRIIPHKCISPNEKEVLFVGSREVPGVINIYEANINSRIVKKVLPINDNLRKILILTWNGPNMEFL